jgi:hypothetical protein
VTVTDFIAAGASKARPGRRAVLCDRDGRSHPRSGSNGAQSSLAPGARSIALGPTTNSMDTPGPEFRAFSVKSDSTAKWLV